MGEGGESPDASVRPETPSNEPSSPPGRIQLCGQAAALRREMCEGSRNPPPPSKPFGLDLRKRGSFLLFQFGHSPEFLLLTVDCGNVHAMYCMRGTKKSMPAKMLDSVVTTLKHEDSVCSSQSTNPSKKLKNQCCKTNQKT